MLKLSGPGLFPGAKDFRVLKISPLVTFLVSCLQSWEEIVARSEGRALNKSRNERSELSD